MSHCSTPGQEPDALLDLFSTSQKTAKKRCINRAPHVCIPPGEQPGKLYQSCCNDWTCPRCGELRAKHEYGRIVEGARTLAKDHQMYFVTLTCTGTISLEDAEKTYLENTNRLLSTFRAHVKKNAGFWAYASVTERQGRGHPHSHYLMTCAPADCFIVIDDYERYTASVARVNAKLPEEMRFSPEPIEKFSFLDMWSEWFALACVKAGLGVQCRVTVVDLVEGVSRYIAKYLFKECMQTDWPEGWRRVRYSQNWPKLPEIEGSSAFVVLSAVDWQKVALLPGTVETFNQDVYERALLWECLNVVCRVPNAIDLSPGSC